MKSLNRIKTRTTNGSTVDNEVDLSKVAFDAGKFKSEKPDVFEALYRFIRESGLAWLLNPMNDNRYLIASDNGYVIIFDFADKNWHKKSKKHAFNFTKKKPAVIDWEKLYLAAEKTKDMSNEELLKYKDVKVTVLSIEKLMGMPSPPRIDRDYVNSMTDAEVQKVFDKKFAMESHRVFLEIEKLLVNADPSDNFYDDLKLNHDKSKQAYYDAAVEYLEELSTFQRTFRQQEHLKILSLVQEPGE